MYVKKILINKWKTKRKAKEIEVKRKHIAQRKDVNPDKL